MHPNPAFDTATDARNAAFARARGFGTLAINGESGPETAHIPFLLAPDGARAEMHLMRSNPIARALAGSHGPLGATLTVLGPDSYISPDWYELPDQVPTWNYIAIRLRGLLELQPFEVLHDLLDRQSAHFETRLDPKPAWSSAKMSDGVMDRMMRAIVPLAMTVRETHGTWKLGQNKPEPARLAAANQVVQNGIGSGLPELGQMMHDPIKDMI